MRERVRGGVCLNLGALDRGWMLGLQEVERSPLDPTTHACLCCLCCPCHPGTPALTPAPSPAPALSAYVIGPSIWAGTVVIGGRAWGAAPWSNQRAAFDSAASAKLPGKTRAGATGSLRRHDDSTTLPAHADTGAKTHIQRGPHPRPTSFNQLPAYSLLSQSQSQSQSPIPISFGSVTMTRGGAYFQQALLPRLATPTPSPYLYVSCVFCRAPRDTHFQGSILVSTSMLLDPIPLSLNWAPSSSGWRHGLHGRQLSPPRDPLRSPR